MAKIDSSHIIDSQFFGDDYSTIASRAIFNDLNRINRWLEVEKALVRCQIKIGIIPKNIGEELLGKGDVGNFDLQRMLNNFKKTKHSLMPVLKEWESCVSKEAAHYIHYGPTTQDIEDTAQMLEMRDVLDIAISDLKEINKILCSLAIANKMVVTIGRTHGQNALPMTMGLKIATWLDEANRNYKRLIYCRRNLLVAQLFGGVGTMAAFKGQGNTLLERFSAELDLKAPKIGWHTTRDRFTEILAIFAIIAGGLARAANEIIQLNKNEIGELSEPFTIGQIGSSTMPHKQNPELCEHVVTLAKLIKGNASLNFDTLQSEHERDYRAMRMEWVTIVDSSMYLCWILDAMKYILSGLIVKTKNIERNVKSASGEIASEALMFHIGKSIGKNQAHHAVYDAAVAAKENNTTLIDEIKKVYTGDWDDLAKTINPNLHLGETKDIIESVVDDAKLTLEQF